MTQKEKGDGAQAIQQVGWQVFPPHVSPARTAIPQQQPQAQKKKGDRAQAIQQVGWQVFPPHVSLARTAVPQQGTEEQPKQSDQAEAPEQQEISGATPIAETPLDKAEIHAPVV